MKHSNSLILSISLFIYFHIQIWIISLNAWYFHNIICFHEKHRSRKKKHSIQQLNMYIKQQEMQF